MQNGNGIKIRHTARFLKSLKNLDLKVLQKLEMQDRLFRKNPFDQKLDTHKLHGRWEGYWAYSIDHRHRVVFVFEKSRMATYYDIGPHRIYGGE